MENSDKKNHLYDPYNNDINLLWTGGWDSTFRLLELSTKQVTIQPFYLKDNRRSETNEFKAMSWISNQIKKESTTKAKINELIVLNRFDIEIDETTKKAYSSIKLKVPKLGSQYEWLSAFSQTVKGLELSLEKGSKMDYLTQSYGKRITIENKIFGDFVVLDNENSPKDLVDLIGEFHFPILDKTKVDMKTQMENLGLMHIMNKTWFCHRPINDKPCGICVPCIQAMEKGMKYRFDSASIFRHKIHKFFEPIMNTKFYKKIKRLGV
ncbi:hypothetical protein [Cognataquiflexum rubidum]|uniref:hypothetical protein n=1 Tax=Cognataquiflexum rubidum TaxID=2922273 RepID=UPI001F1320F1|nr:hypothetical protein [Cognataquiflexum rubidum]MCH6236480.1 hypothetical protein [Cognataquiflexum rubidum]